jgi:branched-chain amino acid transport system permease protein
MVRARRKERVDRGIKVRSDSIYILSSLREIFYLVGPSALLISGLMILPVVLYPWPYWSRVVISACTFGFLAISFDLLANYAGLVCLGISLFFGVGGYAGAILNTQLGLPYFLSIPLATVIGAMICTLLIYPCLPLRGIYFAVVTLMYPLLMTRLIEATNILGGTEGFRGIDGFSSMWVEQYALIIVLLVALFVLRRFTSEDPGLVIRAVKDNDQAVRASGISVTRWRAKTLFIASLLGCFAGAYYVHMYRSVGVSSFALDLSILPIAASVIGGGGTLVGPLIGSLMLVPLGELLREFGSLRIAVYALVLTGFIVYRSEGLLPFVARKYKQFERWVEV